jgi:hypothetical protein
MDAKRRITHEGEIILGENIIPCYVLDDGTRVLSGNAMQVALKMIDDEERNPSGTRLGRYLNQKTLETFIYQGKQQGHYDPLECYHGGQKINGYEATILADICDAFLEARNAIKLSPRQKIIADQCEILVRSFARIGLIALIDEATGYQYDRERFELQKILEAYVLKEAAKWQIMFGLEFYKEIYRLWGVPFTPQNIRRKPKFIAILTNKYIYSQLPDGVYNGIKDINPKTEKGNYKYRHHQYLTTDVGREHQKKIIHEVTAIASISDTKEQFDRLFGKRFAVYYQFDLFDAFGEDIMPKEEPLSEYNRNLKKALDYSEK